MIRGIALALSLGALLACSPRIAPSFPSSFSVEARHHDPARDAHLTLLREAHRAFVQERYSAAVLFFRRFVEAADRGAPRMAEARWWLGRSYEQLGDYRAAMVEYRILAVSEVEADPNQPLYRAHALRRLDELRQVPSVAQAAPARQIALALSLEQIPPVSAWVPWLQSIRNAGVTSLLVDSAPADGAMGADLDRMRTVVEAAHLAGLSVWVSLDLHQGRGLPVRSEWMAVSVGGRQEDSSGGARDVTRMVHPDVTHPAYQAAVEEWAKALIRTGCDGMLLRAREGEGFAKEYSAVSYQLFASAFAVALPSEQLPGVSGGGSAIGLEGAAYYWRWAGWKARSYTALAARIRRHLRDVNPTGRLLIEVHRDTVTRPLTGLEQYGEDLAELLQGTGGAIVVRYEGLGAISLPDSLVQQAGAADRWWLGVAAPGSEPISVAAWVGATLAMVPEQENWNLLVRLPEAARFP